MLPDPLHPAVVHFPIVLAALLAPVVAAGALWAIRRGARPSRPWGLTTLVLAALVGSAWVAAETGDQQEERVGRVVAERPLETHEAAAETFLLVAAGVLVVAAVGLVRGTVGRVARAIGAMGTVALAGVGWRVGHSGGALVYRHGAASAYTGASTRAPATPDAAGTAAEPTRDLDRARALFLASDRPAAARALRSASGALADSSLAAEDGRTGAALTAAARELAVLAEGVEIGAVRSPRALDGPLARARLADARLHHERVMPLIRNLHNARAGAELLWTVDHVERALRDASLDPSAETGAVLRDTRLAATELARLDAGVPVRTAVLVDSLGTTLEQAARRAARLAAPPSTSDPSTNLPSA